MSNHCQRPPGLPGLPADSSIFWTHRELLLSWDHHVEGVIKHLLAVGLSVVWCWMACEPTLSWLVTFWAENLFCGLLGFSPGLQFSSRTVCLFLSDSGSGVLVYVWLLAESFLFLTVGWGSLRRTFDRLWPRLLVTHLSFVASRLLWHRMRESRCSWSGDVWIATSITLLVRALAECWLTDVLSCLRASSSKWCSLFWSFLRSSSLLFNTCRLELRSAVASSL